MFGVDVTEPSGLGLGSMGDRVIFDQRCQAVGVVTEMNPGGNPFSNNLVACKNGIFNAGGGDE